MAAITEKFKYSDLDFNFAKAPSGDVARKFDNNAIKQALRNVLLTNFYERPFRPSFGGNLISRLFESFSEGILSEIRKDVLDTVTRFEPRVTLRDIQTVFSETTETLNVTIEYSFLDEEDSINIVIERVR